MITMLLCLGLAVLIIIVTNYLNKNTMRLELHSVSKFLAFIAIVTVARICLTSFLQTIGIDFLSSSNLSVIPVWALGLVWWEDAVFALPIFLMMKYLKGYKILKIAVIIALSALFASGHLYQGWLAVGLAFFLPYFISYKYGMKVGFGTVMACHVLYDMITYLTVKLMSLFI